MPVPDYQSLMLPTLKAFADHAESSLAEIRDRVAAAEGLSDDDVRELVPSGGQTTFSNRVSWAVNYMMHASLLERIGRGAYRLTNDGQRLLASPPSRIDNQLLRKYPSFAEWKNRSRPPSSDSGNTDVQQPEYSETPDDAMARAARQLSAGLEADVLDRVRDAPPAFLEQVVVDLLIAMGYGGGDSARGQVTGRSGDGGIDGTIREDALGLDEVYVQAKKYAAGSTVGEGDLRNFAGAIDAAGTTKGVFVTTAGFSKSAQRYVKLSPKRIVLIDGEELARLMVQHGIGVRLRDRYEIKRIDEDYFSR